MRREGGPFVSVSADQTRRTRAKNRRTGKKRGRIEGVTQRGDHP